MSIGALYEDDRFAAADYEAVMAQLGEEAPEGCLVHIGGPDGVRLAGHRGLGHGGQPAALSGGPSQPSVRRGWKAPRQSDLLPRPHHPAAPGGSVESRARKLRARRGRGRTTAISSSGLSNTR